MMRLAAPAPSNRSFAAHVISVLNGALLYTVYGKASDLGKFCAICPKGKCRAVAIRADRLRKRRCFSVVRELGVLLRSPAWYAESYLPLLYFSS